MAPAVLTQLQSLIGPLNVMDDGTVVPAVDPKGDPDAETYDHPGPEAQDERSKDVESSPDVNPPTGETEGGPYGA